MNNYYEMGVQNVIQVASNVIETVTPSLIRTGVRLSSISSVGLLGLFSSSLLSSAAGTTTAAAAAGTAATTTTLSIMGRSIQGRNLTQGRGGRLAIRGLVSTFVFGMFTVGSAYFMRAFIRRQQRNILQHSNESSELKKEDDVNDDNDDNDNGNK